MAPKRKAAKSQPAATKAAKKEEIKEDVPVFPPPIEEEHVAEEKPPSAKKAKIEVTPQKTRRKMKMKKKAKTTPAKKDAGKPAAAHSKPESIPKPATAKGTTRAQPVVAARSSKLIIIEASKECNSFKVRATKVETDLKKMIPGLEVKTNPEKPRKGCFEIRDDAGTVFLSLQNMPRPYSKMKNLDLDKTIAEIAEKIK